MFLAFCAFFCVKSPELQLLHLFFWKVGISVLCTHVLPHQRQVRSTAYRGLEIWWKWMTRSAAVDVVGGPAWWEVHLGPGIRWVFVGNEACRMKLQKMDGIYGLDLMVTAHTENDGSETVVEPDIGGRSDMAWSDKSYHVLCQNWLVTCF